MKEKIKRKKCFCGKVIIPHRKVGSRQKTCGAKVCQKELKRRNNARWRKNNPGHWCNDYPRVKVWRDANPEYQREYRKSHPEYVEKCREAQRRRDRSKRLHLAIQDKIRRQTPDVIDQLWKKAHSDNLDIQGDKGMKSLEALFILGYPNFTNRS
jgi:hypothetical protein